MLGGVLLERNVINDKICIFLDDLVLDLKEINERIKRIGTNVALRASLSDLNLTSPIHIEVDASTSS